MCKLGDIIIVKNYIGDDGETITQHSFVVISDEKGTISGLDYTMVASVISSFKSEDHRKRKLKFEENVELPLDAMNKKNFKKSSYVKANQAYYFNKKKLNYYVFASLKDEYLDDLLKIVLKLNSEGKLKIIMDNL